MILTISRGGLVSENEHENSGLICLFLRCWFQMSPSDWAAWIGAAAWSLPIGKLIFEKIRRPGILILPDAWARVGLAQNGPGFNLRLLFSVDRADVILNNLDLVLQHSDGETHTFRWSFLDETFSQIEDSSGLRSTVTRQQTPVALKLQQSALIDNFVRFTEPRYQDKARDPATRFQEHANYAWKTDRATYAKKVLESKELFELTDFHKRAFWWKAGRYEGRFEPSFVQRADYTAELFSFELRQGEIDLLRVNVDLICRDIEEHARANQESRPLKFSDPNAWQWPWVRVSKAKA